MLESVSDDREDNIAGLDSQALIAYRLGRVEKAVEANNVQAIERDNNILGKLDTITTLTTQFATMSLRLDNLESWRKNINAFLVALSMTTIGLIGTLIIRSI